jgi:hypothetical protein
MRLQRDSVPGCAVANKHINMYTHARTHSRSSSKKDTVERQDTVESPAAPPMQLVPESRGAAHATRA